MPNQTHDATSGRPEQVADLVAALTKCVPQWLARCVSSTASGQGIDLDGADRLVIDMVHAAAPVVLAELVDLLDTDVDAQSTNPLAILRSAVIWPTQVLDDLGARAVARDEFAIRHAPDDRYGLAPAGWDDVDADLREPGLMWGAWKAAVVLHRRRAEGQR